MMIKGYVYDLVNFHYISGLIVSNVLTTYKFKMSHLTLMWIHGFLFLLIRDNIHCGVTPIIHTKKHQKLDKTRLSCLILNFQ